MKFQDALTGLRAMRIMGRPATTSMGKPGGSFLAIAVQQPLRLTVADKKQGRDLDKR
jgi:hypothetical protein